MTTKQIAAKAKIVANGGSISGKELEEIGYSKAQAKNPKQIIKSKAIQTDLQKLLKKQGITLKKALKPVGEGLQANKQSIDKASGEYYDSGLPDHATRLHASKMSLDLLGVTNKNPEPVPNNPINDKELIKAIKKGDIKELQRIVFNDPMSGSK